MSFKRDGDEKSLFEKIRKQRISELLTEDIPEDGAFLMKNGKFACMVCSHRPVFDTVDMLNIHRRGRKHVASQEYREEKKEELARLIAKRQHEQYLKDGRASVTVVPGPDTVLGYHMPLNRHRYEPCAKKSRKKPYIPKVKLQLTNQTENVSNTNDQTCFNFKQNLHVPHTEKQESIDFSTHRAPSISEYREEKRNQQCQKFSVKPYSPKNNVTSHVPIIVNNATFETHPTQLSDSVRRAQSIGFPVIRDSRQQFHLQTAYNKDGNQAHQSVHPSRHKKSTKSKTVATVPSEKTVIAEKYLYLRGAGWKKDWVGNWIKDEDAEFDSDEEPPDVA